MCSPQIEFIVAAKITIDSHKQQQPLNCKNTQCGEMGGGQSVINSANILLWGHKFDENVMR